MKLSLAAVFCAALLSSAQVLAADTGIGYVDLRQLITESTIGKAHKAQLEKVYKEKQASIEGEQKKLEDLKAKYDKDVLTMSEAQKAERQKDLQQKVQALQKMAGEAQQDLAKKDQEFTRKAFDDARAVVAEVAKADHLSIVLEKGEANVLYGDPALDVTRKALDKFNARTAKK